MSFPYNLQASGLGFPSSLPPPPSVSSGKIDQIIDENNQLLLLSMEALADTLNQPNTDIGPAVPYLQKLQKNLLHLALLAEQQNPIIKAGTNHTLDSTKTWTNLDLQKLKELLFTSGEDLYKLSQILGKPVEVITIMLNHLKQSTRSLFGVS